MIALITRSLAYARSGRPVFPCGAEKKPLTEHGFKDATTNLDTVTDWWTRWPSAMIATPVLAGEIVVDFDSDELFHGCDFAQAATRVAKTPRGYHAWFRLPAGVEVKPGVNVLGEGIDVRTLGSYVILPPSQNGQGRYEWVSPGKQLTELPAEIVARLMEKTPAQPTSDGGPKIPKGQRHAHLLSVAGKVRTAGWDYERIVNKLLHENATRCNPPKPEQEIRRLVEDVCKRYPAGKQPKAELGTPWAEAEGLDTFLESDEDGAEFFDVGKRMLARASVTELFSPRGLGKSLYALWLALGLSERGQRVMYIDRDNPRHVTRTRLLAFGATSEFEKLKIISREKCPPLTNAGKWALFPYSDYDVVILDSFDSAAEGVGEQDSGKPSRAIAPLLDIARRENGPGVLVLGNTVRTGAHSRGSGVIEDRADIVYEVRDATALHPSGTKPWFEELPPADAGSWGLRASRRKQREKFRLAFVASKFRIGQEPEPFILEIDLTSEPWTIRDITDDIDRDGAGARAQRARENAEKISKARDALAAEVLRCDSAGKAAMLKDRDAIPFLTGVPHKLKRAEARAVIENPEGRWILTRIEGHKGNPIGLVAPGKNENGGGNTPVAEAAKIKGGNEADFRRPHEKGTAEIDPSGTLENSDFQSHRISARSVPHSVQKDDDEEVTV